MCRVLFARAPVLVVVVLGLCFFVSVNVVSVSAEEPKNTQKSTEQYPEE